MNEFFRASENDYDWLGSGVYFWEANPDRALDWARQQTGLRLRNQEGLEEPFVVGAVIDPGFCPDLVSSNGLQAIATAYGDFEAVLSASGGRLPENSEGADHLLRKLDCAVINYTHGIRAKSEEIPFDSVRGVFIKGDSIYKNSGFYRKTHIQICVRNPEMIKGVFRVPENHFSNV
jgi:hypothetical protein